MILIVDDDPRFLEAAERVLDQRGGGVLFALNAEHARSLMGAVGSEFSAALIDVSMPDGEGVSLIREMRHCYPDLPVIAVSAALKRNLLESEGARGARCVEEAVHL